MQTCCQLSPKSSSIEPWQFGELNLTEDGGNRVIKYTDAIVNGVSQNDFMLCLSTLNETNAFRPLPTTVNNINRTPARCSLSPQVSPTTSTKHKFGKSSRKSVSYFKSRGTIIVLIPSLGLLQLSKPTDLDNHDLAGTEQVRRSDLGTY